MTTFSFKSLAKAAIPAMLIVAFASTPVSAGTVSADKTAASTVTQYDLTAKSAIKAQAQADKAARKAAKQAAKKAKKCAKWKAKMHRSVKARGKYNARCVSAQIPVETSGTGGSTGSNEQGGSTSGSEGEQGTSGTGGSTGSAGGNAGAVGPSSYSTDVPTGQIETPVDQVPEPGTLALLGLGLMGLGMTRRKSK